jgi:CRP/FNR family cyclic AMP-dependent transcriptional regulator
MNDQNTERLELLRQMAVFGGLSNETLSFIDQNSPSVTVAAGEYFCREGHQADSLYVIQSGSIVVLKKWQKSDVEIGTMGPGDCFGEMAIIDLQVRSASVKAVEDCMAIQIDRQTLHGMFKNNHEQYAIIMMNMGREISRRLRTVSDRLFELERSCVSPAVTSGTDHVL